MKEEKHHSDQKYIEALLRNDSAIIDEIYRKFAPKVIRFVVRNSGDEMMAYDVIQEGLLAIYDQAKLKGLTLTCPFDAYFFLICKRKWFNTLRKKDNQGVTIREESLSIVGEAGVLAEENRKFEEQQQLYYEMLSKIGKSCEEIIKLGLSNLSMQEVAERLNISYAYARKKKSLCLAKLMELIRENPKYENLKNK